MDQLKRFISFLLILLLLSFCAFAEEPEEIEEWEDLPDDPAETLLATDVFYHTPNEQSAVKCNHELCFWTLEMGRMNEENIWKVLTQPVTVIEGKQREQVRVLARPDETCTEYVGVVTCASQAVHVLERGEEWSLIEAYSSAEEGSAVKVFADPFQGYVRTDRLKKESRKGNSSLPCWSPPALPGRTPPSRKHPPGSS